MKKNKIFIYSTLFIIMMACQSEKEVSEWTDNEIDKWFSTSSWSTELNMKPDVSINKRLFVEQNILNSVSWEAAFKFLKEQDLDALKEGQYNLLDDGTFVNIEEYITRDSAYFEVHRKYIDIQYLTKGKEYIYVTPWEPEKQYEVQAYDEAKDIEFFDKEKYIPFLLSSDNFMVFFPTDGHKPGIRVDTNEIVKKVVVKIPYINNSE